MNIGDRIKNKRLNLDINQNDLAEKIGVSKQTLYKYENSIVTNIPSDKIELLTYTVRQNILWDGQTNPKIIIVSLIWK